MKERKKMKVKEMIRLGSVVILSIWRKKRSKRRKIIDLQTEKDL
jgi:hypothetical protein